MPVDSEHSAIAQCLRGGQPDEVRRLVLTASGGPFLHRSRDELAGVTPEQALAHPTWNMGPVITVNSATLVNKGLELIEAHLLFGIGLRPASTSWCTGSRSSTPWSSSPTARRSPRPARRTCGSRSRWPWPGRSRVAGAASPVDWTAAHTWTFEPLDEAAFPAVALAREAGLAGGAAPAVYNAANEECVAAFLAGRIPFCRDRRYRGAGSLRA